MVFLDRMREHALTGWDLRNVEPIADWAEELRSIPSSNVSKHRQSLVQCGARVDSLTQATPELDTETTPPRKSSRIRKKTSAKVLEASAPTTVPLKAGDIYINAVKVRLYFSDSF
jgi:hypothetical protein